MKVINLRVDWMLPYANNPRLIIEVDKIALPKTTDPVWEISYATDPAYIYCEVDGFVLYQTLGGYNEKKPGHGFGGRTFTFTLKNGTKIKTNDSWSGNPRGLPIEVMDVALTRTHNQSAYSAAMTLTKVKELLEERGNPFYLFKCEHGFWSPSLSPDRVQKPL
jgi:hypothetical protein